MSQLTGPTEPTEPTKPTGPTGVIDLYSSPISISSRISDLAKLPIANNDPRAFYQRCLDARKVWYKAQPRGSLLTDQQYRKAMGL